MTSKVTPPHLPMSRMDSHNPCKPKMNSCEGFYHCKAFACKDSVWLVVLLIKHSEASNVGGPKRVAK